MSNASIEAAFRIRLNSLGLAPVWFENAPMPASKPYLEARFMPAETAMPVFGPDGLRRYTGLYHVNVVTDAGIGSGAASSMADGVVDAFQRGSEITAGEGPGVTIEKAWRSQAMEGDDRYVIPVSIRYWSYRTY
ncbi:phage tail terminator-like protein [Immundisolibacter sp.]